MFLTFSGLFPVSISATWREERLRRAWRLSTTAATGTLSDKYPGFLNHYSTTGVAEDKAEIFAYLFVDPAELSRRAETDAVLRTKVELMKRLLEEFCREVKLLSKR